MLIYIESSSSLERLDEDYWYDSYYPAHKRRRFIEEFDALSIEDDSTGDINKYCKRMYSNTNYLKQEYNKNGFGWGKRRRWKMSNKNGLGDFSELKRQIQAVEDKLTKVAHQKVLFGKINQNSTISKKKRDEKQKSKELAIATWTQVSNEKKIIELIIKCKEIFPKLYNKLIDIYTIFASNVDHFQTNDPKINNFSNLNSEGEKSWQSVVDEFVNKVNQYTMRANSKLADEVIYNMVKGLEEDYEMVGVGVENNFHVPKVSLLSITDSSNRWDNYAYITPISPCIVEEVD